MFMRRAACLPDSIDDPNIISTVKSILLGIYSLIFFLFKYVIYTGKVSKKSRLLSLSLLSLGIIFVSILIFKIFPPPENISVFPPILCEKHTNRSLNCLAGFSPTFLLLLQRLYHTNRFSTFFVVIMMLPH